MSVDRDPDSIMFFVVCHNSTAAGNGNGQGTAFQLQSLTEAFCSQVVRWMQMKAKINKHLCTNFIAYALSILPQV